MKYILILLITSVSLGGGYAFAQENLDDQEVINVENLYKNNPPPKSQTPQNTGSELSKEEKDIQNNTDVQNSRVKSLTDLNRLAPFSDISVIQRKFLPKTERYQLYLAGGLTTNSPWFLNIGAKVNFGYNFTESLGVEFSGMFLTNSERESAKEIRENNNLQPDKFVITKNYLGASLVWSPIYGKITNTSNEIIPFDMYFSGSLGMSGTNSQEKTVPTFGIGTGQIFAISKSMAFRWDYAWNFYSATPVADSNSTSAPQKSSFNDLIFTAGVSFFFPEATYR